MHKFKFKTTVPRKDWKKLRNYLHKVSFNINEAYVRLAVVEYFSSIQAKSKTTTKPALSYLFITSVENLMLPIRRLFDATGKRSLRALIKEFVANDQREKWLLEVERIYSRYSKFINKLVVHQDEQTIKEALDIPDSNVIKEDVNFAAKAYMVICQTYCSIRTDQVIDCVGVDNKPKVEVESLRALFKGIL